ncbi:MAG: Crp/Fnr family transcriptional regulator [Leptolinea sp.]
MQYQLPIFENLCPSWEKVLSLGVRSTFPKGSNIFDLDDTIKGVYYIKAGTVEINLFTIHGPEKALFIVGPGCVFGEVSCFMEETGEEASGRARTDCELYYFKKEIIEGQIASQSPELIIELVRSLAYKIQMYTSLLKDSLISNLFIRVCKMLVYLVRFKEANISLGQKNVWIRPDITQNDMARLMGVHRVTVTKAIGRLKTMGILRRFSKRCLEITDFPRLVKLVESADY